MRILSKEFFVYLQHNASSSYFRRADLMAENVVAVEVPFAATGCVHVPRSKSVYISCKFGGFSLIASRRAVKRGIYFSTTKVRVFAIEPYKNYGCGIGRRPMLLLYKVSY